MPANALAAPPRASLGTAIAVGGSALALYVATLAPGLAWGDGAELQRLAITGGVRVDAHAHPMWLWLAGAFAHLPWGAPAWRVNLSSAVFGAVAVALVYLAAERLTRRRAPAVLAALAFAVSHTFWLHAVQTEVYALFMAWLALALLLFAAWRDRPRAATLLGLGAVSGVALLSHLLIVTAVPGLAVGVGASAPRGGRGRALALLAAGGLAGAALFVAVAGLNPFLHPVYGKGGPLTILDPPRAGDVVRWAAFTLYQFPLALPLAAWGAGQALSADLPLAAALLLVALGDVGFALCFRVPDQYVFYLPSYLVAALFLALGVAALPGRGSRSAARVAALGAALVVAPPALYALAPRLAAPAQRALVHPRTLPGRDNARFFLDPPKRGERSAERYTHEAFHVLPESAFVVADWAPLEALVYVQQLEHARPDLAFTESRPAYPPQLDTLVQLGRRRPVFIADDDPPPYYDVDGLRRHFDLLPVGPLYRLVPKREAGSPGR